MSAFPPSAAIVSAARKIHLAPCGKVSNSLSAALIQETGLARNVISLSLALFLFSVVIFDNIVKGKLARGCNYAFVTLH
jgi:hypothetical protein